MKTLLTVTLFCTIGFALADVASEFQSANITSDILKGHGPTDLIEVKYGNNVVNLGNELTPTQVKQIPEIHYKHEGGVLYTLVMTDPDVPTRGYNREFNHWLVGNIPEESVEKGEVLAEYVGSGPPQGSGLHRYVFLVYRQDQGAITFDERRLSTWDGKQRRRFSIQKFAEKYSLVGPLAGNYFTAKWDESVPDLHKHLGF
ncbi:protein D2-like [Neodiprion virginianus]|uniref:Protein D2 n=2 Tax=Neodiprion TaxID=270857 RepID=A0A6J0BHD5_NEOLC|nr:protein D2 [Neodiprion lecontei]XP_046432726.1 protein D2-like [Neodiprion fabricii]XP_046489524.1 protein D2-like [Neodiprion pinetum]XP_046626549.1 protein D2-like [Neodiprion virginianus]